MTSHSELDRFMNQPKDPSGLTMSDAAIEANGPRLEDGSPLYQAFIPEDKLVIKSADVQAAKNTLAKCIEVDSKAVERAAGKSAEEARHILWGILGH